MLLCLLVVDEFVTALKSGFFVYIHSYKSFVKFNSNIIFNLQFCKNSVQVTNAVFRLFINDSKACRKF